MNREFTGGDKVIVISSKRAFGPYADGAGYDMRGFKIEIVDGTDRERAWVKLKGRTEWIDEREIEFAVLPNDAEKSVFKEVAEQRHSIDARIAKGWAKIFGVAITPQEAALGMLWAGLVMDHEKEKEAK